MEKLLHYVWRHKMLPPPPLLTTDGLPVEVVDTGLPNSDAGPDFFNAKVKIGSTMWAGNVEMHMRSSDWFRHGHDSDPAYDSVILHVAEKVDCEVRRPDGKAIPQVELPLPADLCAHYEELCQVKDYPRCHKIIPHVDAFKAHSWMDCLLCERLEEKAKAVRGTLADFGGDWERTLFSTLARNFGFGLNGDAFEAWAKLVPLPRLGKHRDELFQIEAIFLGLAGLLPDPSDKASADQYAQSLLKEYAYQSRLFSLPPPMPRTAWKYLRLRPQNFPHIRLAELAWMYSNGKAGLSALLDAVRSDKPLNALSDVLSATASPYWATHVMFGKPTKPRRISLSKSTKQLLTVNTAVPVLYAYALSHDDQPLRERLCSLLTALPAEDNRILRLWGECGLQASNAADSQALIQLKRNYCDRSDCLRCAFGHEYLKRPL